MILSLLYFAGFFNKQHFFAWLNRIGRKLEALDLAAFPDLQIVSNYIPAIIQ
jgi:hypothetical protein